MPGVPLCCSADQAHREAPWLGSYSVVQCIRYLIGQTLCCSTADAGVWGERGYGASFTPMCDSAVSPCFHVCLAFLHQHFPPRSPPSHPLNPSLHSQQQPSPWDCSTIPKLQLPAFGAIHGTNVPVQGLHGCGKNYLILIPFRLPQISCFTLSPQCFSLTQTVAPMWGSDPCFHSPTS